MHAEFNIKCAQAHKSACKAIGNFCDNLASTPQDSQHLFNTTPICKSNKAGTNPNFGLASIAHTDP